MVERKLSLPPPQANHNCAAPAVPPSSSSGWRPAGWRSLGKLVRAGAEEPADGAWGLGRSLDSGCFLRGSASGGDALTRCLLDWPWPWPGCTAQVTLGRAAGVPWARLAWLGKEQSEFGAQGWRGSDGYSKGGGQGRCSRLRRQTKPPVSARTLPRPTSGNCSSSYYSRVQSSWQCRDRSKDKK